MSLQSGNNSRYIHPNIYDCPQAASENDITDLPFLNWEADIAKNVRTQIIMEWNSLSKEIKVLKNQEINAIVEKNRQLHVSSRAPSIFNQLDLVIIAVGFGLEKTVANVEFKSYTIPKNMLEIWFFKTVKAWLSTCFFNGFHLRAGEGKY
jgi:hypothetical protein